MTTLLARMSSLTMALLVGLPAQNTSISWSTDMAASYRKALAENKPMVVLFTRADGENCRRLEAGPLVSTEINSLAGQAIWVRANSAAPDAHAQKMMNELKLQRVPYLTVLDVGTAQINERGAVEGYFDTPRYYFLLSQILLKPSTRVSSRDLTIPANLPAVAAARPAPSKSSAADARK